MGRNSVNDFVQTACKVEEILSQNKIVHYYTGGLVASYYGEPRYTQDIDIVVVVSLDQLSLLLSALENAFFINKQSSLSEYRDGQIFQAIYKETAIKIDFHVNLEPDDAFVRVTERELLPNTMLPSASIIDAIISKLFWIKKGSHKSRQDVRMMWYHCADDEKLQIKQIAQHKKLDDILDEVLTTNLD